MEGLPRFDDWTIQDDYLELPEDIHAELIDGRIMLLEFPTTDHYDAAGEIYSQLKLYLRGKRCRVYNDLRVKLYDHADNIYRPDISLVCNPNKRRFRMIVGAPDLIVEVLSPSNRSHDTGYKRERYQEAGVREYWMVDLKHRSVEVLLLQGNKYVSTTYSPSDSIRVSVLDDCSIDLEYVFPSPEEDAPT